ncbi:sideroflexin-1-like [Macrosteles quadrilineatus]|uniref:sideroflexin-1-like n=1 Tax=Macrosteles quadrilineatus TaxID=74068 RepID=UPI0023E15C83|nr:sideroflexin-1-like [Macrosteles quadrilineatus]XP_054268029.1 sideroflexin-1-like [Macrosteles quadrilineatus]
MTLPRVNIDEPRWDQSTYWGRAKYFFTTTNPLNIFCSAAELDKAKAIVDKYRAGEPLDGHSLDDVYRAKELVDSAFHPDTGEKMIVIGRMSAQVPMNMVITGCMVTFYKSTPAVVFWQWVNQSFNALVNYTNRSGKSPLSVEQLGKSYVLATGGALATALSLNKLAQRGPPLMGRLVPFAAVAAANCINIPLMRYREVENGVPVYDANNNHLGDSQTAAKIGIAAVVFSRIFMAAPGMVFTPVVMNSLERKGLLRKIPWANAPLQLLLCGFFLTFATPMCCALFPQKSPIQVSKLEKPLQEKAKDLDPPPTVAYYNKGL